MHCIAALVLTLVRALHVRLAESVAVAGGKPQCGDDDGVVVLVHVPELLQALR